MQTYHTVVKDLIRYKKCPKKILKLIPRSNIYRWQQEKDEKYIHFSINGFDTIAQSYCVMPGLLFSIGRLILLLNRIKINAETSLSIYKEEIIYTLSKSALPLSLSAKCLGISVATFYQWKREVLLPCTGSVLKKCFRTYPMQLTTMEVKLIIEVMSNESTKYWSMASLYLKAVRDELVTCGLSTFYLYIKHLGLRSDAKPKYIKQFHPLRASFPNQYIHADITLFKTINGIKHYIYLVVDNYSRNILSYAVSTKFSVQLRIDTIKEALNRAKCSEQNKQHILITDAGIENENEDMDSFTLANGIIKLVAQKDIHSSNSLIEAINKMLKYTNLYTKPIQNTEELTNAVKVPITIRDCI
jgi:putative transposase